jgi:hypothetical protein
MASKERAHAREARSSHRGHRPRHTTATGDSPPSSTRSFASSIDGRDEPVARSTTEDPLHRLADAPDAHSASEAMDLRRDVLVRPGRAGSRLTIADRNRGSSPRSTGWLPRAGAGRVLKARGTEAVEITLPRAKRSREWLTAAVLECARCHQVVERRSPIERHCPDCRAALKRGRSRDAIARARAARPQTQRVS